MPRTLGGTNPTEDRKMERELTVRTDTRDYSLFLRQRMTGDTLWVLSAFTDEVCMERSQYPTEAEGHKAFRARLKDIMRVAGEDSIVTATYKRM